MPSPANRPRGALVQSVRVGDPEAADFFDLALAADRIARRLSGDPDLVVLRCKYGLTAKEIVRRFAPHAHRDPGSGAVTLNAGYDPGHAEGRLERRIWALVQDEARALVSAEAPRLTGGASPG